MTTHENAEALLVWLRDRASATVGNIVASGLLEARAASDAVQYAVRSGGVERFVRLGVTAKERVRYRATGIALPTSNGGTAPPSFDSLLEAWGIVREPVALPTAEARRHRISDNG